MIKELGKNKAKLIVDVGSRKDRHRRTKIVEYKGKRDLKRLYDEFESEVKAEVKNGLSVDNLVDDYIANREILGLSANTIRGYKIAAKRISADLGDVLAADLTTYQIEHFVASAAPTWSSKTIRNTVGLLSAALGRAVKTGLLKSNPCIGVTLPKKDSPETDIFTDEQIGKFLGALSKETLDYQVGYKLALFCGLRRSEILGLREEHVSIPFKMVTICDTRHRVNGEDLTQGTKTSQSQRTLAIPDVIVEDLARLIEEHHALSRKSDYIVQNGFGEPLNPSTFSNHIYHIEKEAGLPRVSLHDLRHTFASMLNAAHIDIARISRELGHSNITTTMSVYTHVFNGATESSRGIANAIDEKCGTLRGTRGQEKTAESQ